MIFLFIGGSYQELIAFTSTSRASPNKNLYRNKYKTDTRSSKQNKKKMLLTLFGTAEFFLL